MKSQKKVDAKRAQEMVAALTVKQQAAVGGAGCTSWCTQTGE